MKVRIAWFSVSNWRAIYTQKLTLVCIWYTRVWPAYDTQSMLVVEKKEVAVLNPTPPPKTK